MNLTDTASVAQVQRSGPDGSINTERALSGSSVRSLLDRAERFNAGQKMLAGHAVTIWGLGEANLFFCWWCFTSTETIGLIMDGRLEVGEEGGREIISLSLHCHHQNESCIKMGSDESHFNVSLIVRDKVTRQCPQTQPLRIKRKESRNGIEPSPSAHQPKALPLGQTGSRVVRI